MLELLRVSALGMDPFDREAIWQKLHLGARWAYQKPGWFDPLDSCLWDTAGKAVGLPVYELLGRVREGFTIYQTAGDGPLELYVEHIEQGKGLPPDLPGWGAQWDMDYLQKRTVAVL